MFFGVPGFTNTPVQKRGNQCFTESKSFGSMFDSEQSSTWLKNVQTIQNDRQHLLHGTRFTKVDQRLGPGIRSGHLWWMIGNAHENRNAHLVMVQTWAPKKKMQIPTWQNKRNIGQHRMVNTTKSAGSYSNFRIHPVVTPFHWAANGGHAKEAQRQPPMWPAGHGTCNCRRHLRFASYITTAPFFGNILCFVACSTSCYWIWPWCSFEGQPQLNFEPQPLYMEIEPSLLAAKVSWTRSSPTLFQIIPIQSTVIVWAWVKMITSQTKIDVLTPTCQPSFGPLRRVWPPPKPLGILSKIQPQTPQLPVPTGKDQAEICKNALPQGGLAKNGGSPSETLRWTHKKLLNAKENHLPGLVWTPGDLTWLLSKTGPFIEDLFLTNCVFSSGIPNAPLENGSMVRVSFPPSFSTSCPSRHRAFGLHQNHEAYLEFGPIGSKGRSWGHDSQQKRGDY